MWALKWRRRKGVEVPIVEPAKSADKCWLIARPTKRAAIEASLANMQKTLDKAREAVAAYENSVAQLERLLVNAKAAECRQEGTR